MAAVNLKTLLVMRHAKSSWKESGLADYDRPLNKRGLKAAPFMADVLQQKQLVPQLLISSSAVRAQQTTELVLQHWSSDVRCLLDQSLYLAAPKQYLRMLSDNASEENCVMVVGHNPGLEYLIEELTGEDEFMPTAAVAVISLEGEWSGTLRGQLVDVIRPREIE